MCKKILIWIVLAACGLPVEGAADQRAPSIEPSLTVSTHRSDGAIFPAVAQTKRLQRQRRVRLSGSSQALPNLATRTPIHEPASGGMFVAPASENLNNSVQVSTAFVYVPQNLTTYKPKLKKKP
jgi:hypothetical protein